MDNHEIKSLSHSKCRGDYHILLRQSIVVWPIESDHRKNTQNVIQIIFIC